MYLHITHDDKFIDYFINDAKRFTTSINKYIIIANENEPLKFVKSKDVTIASWKSEKFWKAVEDLGQYKAIFFHYLEEQYQDLITLTPKETCLVWVFWGAEAFSLPLFNRIFLKPETFRIYKRNRFPAISFNPKYLFKSLNLYYNFLKLERERQSKLKNMMKEFHYFAHYIPEDYEIIKKGVGISAKYIDYSYQTSSFASLTNDINFPAKLTNILIGNSGAYSNNHIEILRILKKIDSQIPEDINLIVPLSYSGDSSYVSYIEETGRIFFGAKFKALKTFISKEEYNSILMNCSACIFNHVRSQAGGNIFASIVYGKRIFLDSKSSLYKLYKRNGAVIFSIDDILEKPELLFTVPSPVEIEKNKQVLEKLFGEQAVKRRYLELLTI